MRNGWKWLTLAFASLWVLTWATSTLAAPSVGNTSVRPHRVLQQGATADGSVSTWFVFEAEVTAWCGQRGDTDVFVTFNGVPALRLSPVGGNLYRAAIKGSEIGVGTHVLGVRGELEHRYTAEPCECPLQPRYLIVIGQITEGVLSRAQLWRVKTLFDDEVAGSNRPPAERPTSP
jgi:hypothetical protein